MSLTQKPFLFNKTVLFNQKSTNQNSRIFMLAILFAGFLVRVIVCFFVSKFHIQRDTLDYFEQADILLAGGYKNYFPNGYPFIIALSKNLSGNYFITVLLWLNIFLSTAVIFFIYDITKKISNNNNIALIAACLIAFFPTQINYVRWILSEVPSVFFITGFFFFYFRKQNLLAGIFIGLATIVRTELLLILPLVALTELIPFRKVSWSIIAGLLIPVLITGFYCRQKTGVFSLSGHGKVNIAYSITASGSYIDWMYNDKHPEIKTSGDAMRMYFDEMKNNPGKFIKNRCANLWELWGFFPSSSDGNRKLAARLLIGSVNLFLIVFGFIGWWTQKRNYYAFILIFPFVVVTIVHTFLVALPRYTYTAEPFLIILSSIGLYTVLSKFKLKKNF